MKYRHNVMNISTIDAFLNIRGSVNNDQRDIYFVRSLGENVNFVGNIANIDKKMKELMHQKQLAYIRISKLLVLMDRQDMDYYTEVYNAWIGKGTFEFKNIEKNNVLHEAIRNACDQVSNIYREAKANVSETMLKNLMVKILFWLDSIMGNLLKEWHEKKCIKVIADNVDKEHEYLFYLFLTYLGCDVLLIENKKDIEVVPKLLEYSYSFVVGEYGTSSLLEYIPGLEAEDRKEEQKEQKTEEGRRNVLVIPEHPRRNKPGNVSSSNANSPNVSNLNVNSSNIRSTDSGSAEKSFEELAQLASSIVMIKVHDRNGEVMGSGSGIMIGYKGYILTNDHVTAGGSYYSVRIEDDDEVYTTHEVIKYNTTTDLAVIRINRTLKPLKIYNGYKELVRGQKVVAIGSPLGLFNSVSDGIISGFRKINDVDMMQFTAPISSGSSGGAVLNMHGEVIGISTAGIDRGQNINLAIGYESIRMFASGFMT